MSGSQTLTKSAISFMQRQSLKIGTLSVAWFHLREGSLSSGVVSYYDSAPAAFPEEWIIIGDSAELQGDICQFEAWIPVTTVGRNTQPHFACRSLRPSLVDFNDMHKNTYEWIAE
jgi:hypothetical protein